MKQEEKEIILRSEDVTEILSSIPNWTLRWGISVIFILLILGVLLSFFIKYPDVLTAEITITTTNPPVILVAKTSGKLTVLLRKDKQDVKQGEVIAVIENTANYKDVLFLEEQIKKAIQSVNIEDSLLQIEINNKSHVSNNTQLAINVGELTPQYLQVLKTIKDFNLYQQINPVAKQIVLLKKDLADYQFLLSKYKRQQIINDEQLKLYEIDYIRDKKLFEEKAISAREYENKRKEYLNALNSNEQIKITISNVLIQINNTEKNILQLQIQDYQEWNKLKTELLQSSKNLLSEINKWKQLYLIQSPVTGKISFFNIWVVNQNIKSGDELFAIIPHQKQEYIGKCILPITNSGKLALHQKVNIKLDNYPYQEVGTLQGTVNNISEVPNKDHYMIDVKLPDKLITSYNKPIIYKEQMKGKAEIITIYYSISDRIFFNFKKLLNRNSKL